MDVLHGCGTCIAKAQLRNDCVVTVLSGRLVVVDLDQDEQSSRRCGFGPSAPLWLIQGARPVHIVQPRLDWQDYVKTR